MVTVYYNNKLLIHPEREREREREREVGFGWGSSWWVWCTVFLFEVKM